MSKYFSAIAQSRWMSPIVLALIAIAIRAAQLNEPAVLDELYHVLAAKGWLTEGRMTILTGTYERAYLYTLFVANIFQLFGPSIEAVRMTSALLGGVLVVLVFLWTRSFAGTTAAWIAALLLCFDSEAVLVSQFARFYALHGVLFWLGAIGLYTVFEDRAPAAPRAVIAAASIFCLGVSVHLQMTTLIGLVGIGAWIGLAVIVPWTWSRLPSPALRWGLIGGFVVIASAGLAVVLTTSLGQDLWTFYRWTPVWASNSRDAFWFYYVELLKDFPTLWPLFPMAVLVAMAYRPKECGFAICVFAVAFVLHSFGGVKNNRLLYYAMPFFFVIWGVALQKLFLHIRPLFQDVRDRLAALLTPQSPKRWVSRALMALAVLFLVLSNTTFVKTGIIVAGVSIPPMIARPHWAAAKAPLQSWLDNAAVVVAGEELSALFYLGRADIILSKSRLSELDEAIEFRRDHRTGLPVVSEPQSVAQIIDCYADGLIVTDVIRWRNPEQLDNDVADIIERRAQPIPLPKTAGIRAFSWKRSPGASIGRCAELPEFVGK
jgi:4-amino-4-deoxy-L-arabinose transferase-like glycosyltransferase